MSTGLGAVESRLDVDVDVDVEAPVVPRSCGSPMGAYATRAPSTGPPSSAGKGEPPQPDAAGSPDGEPGPTTKTW